MQLKITEAMNQVNETQKQRLLEKVALRFGQKLTGKRFAVWGLAFKANTNDMREATSQVIVPGLIARGATVVAYDPVAMDEAKKAFAELPRLEFATSPRAALDG